MNIADHGPIIDANIVDDEPVFRRRDTETDERRTDKRGSKMKTLLSIILTIALLIGIGYLGIKILDNSPPTVPASADNNKQTLANQLSVLNERAKDKFNQIKNLDVSNKPDGDAKGDLGKDRGLLRVPKGYGPIDEEDKRLTGEILKEEGSRLTGHTFREEDIPKTEERRTNNLIKAAQQPFVETDNYQYKPEDLKRLGTIQDLYVKASEALDW